MSNNFSLSRNNSFKEYHSYDVREATNLEIFYEWLNLYYTPTIIGVGILGNLLSTLVLLLSKLRKFSSSHYLACIVLVNTLYLVVSLLMWMRGLRVNTFDRPFACQVVSFTKEISTFLSLWVMVAFVVDRYIAICWPAEAARFCTVMRSRIVIAGLTIFSMVIYLNTSLTVGVALRGRSKIPICSSLGLNGKSMMAFDILDMTCNRILAYCALIILYILICRSVFCCNSDLRLGDSSSHFSLLTVVYVLCYLLTQLPAEIMYLHLNAINIFRLEIKPTTEYIIAYNIAGQFATTLKCINVFLFMGVHPLFLKYMAAGCTKVGECVRKCVKSKKNKHQIEEQITLQESV